LDPVVLGKKKECKTQKRGTSRKNRRFDTNEANPSKQTDIGRGGNLPQISTDLKQSISKSRQDKGWTQKELAATINERVTLVADYEAGT
jgi:putative transcription factor